MVDLASLRFWEAPELTSGDPLHVNQVAVSTGNGARRMTSLGASLLDSKVLGQVQTASDYGFGELSTLFLSSRADTIYGGTNQIQRNIIAERALGLPREPRGDIG